MVNRIDISVDGIDEESCSKIRGAGVFTKVMNTINLLHSHNFNKISLSMVMTEENEKLKDKFIALNAKLGTKCIARKFSPIGRGEKNREMFKRQFLHYEESKELTREQKENIIASLSVCKCGAASKSFYINYKGDIFPCGLLMNNSYNMGNITQIKDFKEYYINNKLHLSDGYLKLQSIQPDQYQKCKGCNVNLFCWNCLHYLDVIKDESEIFDKMCKIVKKQLQNVIWG